MKYPRTYHLSFSQEIFNDDKMLDKKVEESFINTEIVITEKLDGGNCCLFNGKIYARSHTEETNHPSFSMVKSLYNSILYTKDFEFDRYMLFGENMQAIHSIKYTKIKSPFYLFNILDTKTDKWISLKELKEISNYLNIPMVPIIFEGTMQSLGVLKLTLERNINRPSYIGGEKEGFVIRKTESFNKDKFNKNVCKFVRRGHVQSDEHWSKNWKTQKIVYN
jgi:ATP-dependent RNA circularization protein (DNA/RNA ligase family)